MTFEKTYDVQIPVGLVFTYRRTVGTNMKKRILTILFFSICVLGYSQNQKTIYPNFIGLNSNEVENNLEWEILEKVTGDLNKDGNDDQVLILESKDSIPEKRCSDCELLKTKPRIILVLLKQDDKQKVIVQNNKFIARGDEGGMANYIEPELSINDGLLNIYYQYTRSIQSYTFEFKNDRMEIVKAESMGVHSASGNYENDKYDFINGTLISRTGNISEEESKTEIIEIDIKSKSLSEFEEMYTWEITEYKLL